MPDVQSWRRVIRVRPAIDTTSWTKIFPRTSTEREPEGCTLHRKDEFSSSGYPFLDADKTRNANLLHVRSERSHGHLYRIRAAPRPPQELPLRGAPCAILATTVSPLNRIQAAPWPNQELPVRETMCDLRDNPQSNPSSAMSSYRARTSLQILCKKICFAFREATTSGYPTKNCRQNKLVPWQARQSTPCKYVPASPQCPLAQ